MRLGKSTLSPLPHAPSHRQSRTTLLQRGNALHWSGQRFKFRPYLDGRHFTVLTDHAALQWLDTARFANCKLERWALRLQEFDFTVRHLKGEQNVVADCLSRLTTAEQPLATGAASH